MSRRPYNRRSQLQKRRQEALVRREKNLEQLTNTNNDQKKIDRAKADIVALYSKLGMKKAS